MIFKFTHDIAAKMGIKLSHVSILDNSAFSSCNRKSLKISSGGKLSLVSFTPEEQMNGDIGDELKGRISSTLSDLSRLT